MKVLIIMESLPGLEPILNQTRQKLESFFENVSFELWSQTTPGFTRADIETTGADLLLTFDLAGFGQSTLMGGITYNLVKCKQIHILLQEKLPKESVLSKPLSIAMFFYCAGHEHCERLRTAYPDIPYLKELGGWSQEDTITAVRGNAEVLCGVIREVAGICHICRERI